MGAWGAPVRGTCGNLTHGFDITDAACPDNCCWWALGTRVHQPWLSPVQALGKSARPPFCLAQARRVVCRHRHSAVGLVQAADAVHRICLTTALTPTPASGTLHTFRKQAMLGLLHSLLGPAAGQDQAQHRHQHHRSRSRHSVSPSDHASQQLRVVLPHLGQSLRTAASQATDPPPAMGAALATTQLPDPQVALVTHLASATLRAVLDLCK